MLDLPVETAPAKTLRADRRDSARVPRAYPAVICDLSGGVLTRGRTTNISQRGVFVVATGQNGPPKIDQVVLELTVPKTKARLGRRRRTRKVRYLARVVRTQTLGSMFGLGIELLEKLS